MLVALQTVLHRVNRLALGQVSDPAVALPDQMRGRVEHSLVVLRPDEIRLHSRQHSVDQAQRQVPAHLLDQLTVAPVSIRIEDGTPEALIQNVAKVSSLAHCILLLRADLIPQIQKHGVIAGFFQCLIHSPKDTLLDCSASVMIASGLAGYGFQFINIDDGWQAGRDGQGIIQPNAKFPDLKSTSDYVHSRGLKFGVCSSPGPQTCGGYTGSYQHEAQDARSYAGWGVDYLKYDWCSYDQVVQGNHSVPVLEKPYDVMGAALAAQPRDIVYSLCQYGWGDVWKWGATTGGSSWRTTDDIQDNWGSLHAIYESQAGHEKYAGPGHWNDPDMLMVGVVGFGNTHPTHLRPNEQILHISMWCLLSAPLLIGCDMTKLDPFTLALLSNDEALDIDQDPLGKPARLVHSELQVGEVWARPLFDGTQAVGLVNPNPWVSTLTVQWADLGLQGPQPVRDLWLHQNVGTSPGHYSVEVPAHGCVLLKVGRPAAQQ